MASRLTLPIFWGIAAALTFASPLNADEPEKFVTGPDFRKLLNRPLLANRDYSPLRDVLDRLAEDRHIAVCLDRKIDPSRLVFVDIQAPYFDIGLSQIVENIPADVVVIGDTVCVTTPENARTLRTRAALAEQQLNELPNSGFSTLLDVTRRRPVHWEKLAQPRQLLLDIAQRWDFTIENPDAIPYDLWDAGDLAHPNLIEALLWISSQYDLGIEWLDDHSLRLVPLAPDPVIEQDHAYRGRTRSQTLTLMKETFPDLPARFVGGKLRVTGRVEEQEAIAVLLGNRPARKPTVPVVDTNLANRRFTLTMINRPFSELLDALEKQQIQFDRHENQLKEAGIDLNQQITLELDGATIDQMFSAACEQLGLSFQIDGTRIELFPATRKMDE